MNNGIQNEKIGSGKSQRCQNRLGEINDLNVLLHRYCRKEKKTKAVSQEVKI